MNPQTVWYPYTQMQEMKPPQEVVSAQGVYLKLKDGTELIDAISSWWCMIHGYGHPALNSAIKDQVDILSHVMLGGIIHPMAQQLADKLVAITPEGLNHVFFSDSGSVGVEVAIKMAVQYWFNKAQPDKHKIVALRKAYHGDTCATMALSDPDYGFHKLFNGLVPDQLFVDQPQSGFRVDGVLLRQELDGLERFFKKNHHNIAAFIVEPICQAVGGYHFHSGQYLQGARALCDRYNILLIFDEIATGFGRTGKMFAAEHANVSPDIMVLGKTLTGGYIGHAATLASTALFAAFLGKESQTAFMHGPTFMGNALACAVALKSIALIEENNLLSRVIQIETILTGVLLPIKSDKVKEVRVLGAIGVVEVYDSASLEKAQTIGIENGVWLRPFGPYLYVMPPYIISDIELKKVCGVVQKIVASI